MSADRFDDRADPALRLGLSPLPSAFRLPIPTWSAAPDLAPRPLRRAAVPPSLASMRAWRPAATGPLPAPPAVADTAATLAGDTTEQRGVFHELELPGVVQDVADLGLRVEGRGELGGDWNRFRPCDPQFDVNCSPDLLPRLQPDIEFGIQVDGTLTDRFHVDVDYDQRREFDAANSISVYYEGRSGEVIQRMEMGDVSIELPASRYLTRGIPAGNFGFKTTADLRGLALEAVWAQQKGDIATREFRLGGAGQEGLVQDQELVLDDADYVTGQFFFLVDPRELDGWPHIDVMTLERFAAPASARPRADGLTVYRDQGVTMQRYADQAQAGTFLADAVTDGGELSHAGLFGILEPGDDYYIHPSGLWIALRAPLRGDEALAVAYVSESGREVGDPAAEAAPPGETPELRLVRGPITIHQPGQPTWPWEMHQVYRLDSSAQVETSTLSLTISLGYAAGGRTFINHAGRSIPLLRLFGLDDDAPADHVDLAHLFRPGAEDEMLGPGGLRGTFLVFPTLEPFGAPPPVPTEGLTAGESGVVLGSDANAAIYDEQDPVIRTSSSRFRLNFRYQVRLEGLLSSFNLGAFGIRPGSERVSVDDRLLVRGVDYVIDYDVGLVTLLDPQAVLGSDPDAQIRTSWEQKSLFDIAPTTVFGLNAVAPMGGYGELNFIGLYQSQQSVVRRPQLGTAPGAVILGGASGRLAFQADWLSRAMDAVPFLTVDSVARLDVSGELALSAADPNRQGATYLDDFESTDELSLSLDAAEWQLGSAPQDASSFPMNVWPLTVENATELVWQDRYREGDREVGFLTPQEIDEEIALAGARLAEPVLYLTMGGDRAAVPQWRSLTTVLSTTGQDLSRSEYLEFYAAPLSGPVGAVTLIVDIGTVSEDAFYVDSTGALGGVNRFGQAWGRDVLDSEARLALREVWGPENDRRGLWNQTCTAERLTPVPLGDLRANCTVLNGRPDSEDLDNNGVLDAQDGPSFRFTVPLGEDSPYLVRGTAGTNTAFRLFRIPLRGPGAVPLNGATEATWRFVKHLRITAVKPTSGQGTLRLARLRIAGSRWTKRDLSGVLDGLTGDVTGSGAATTNVRVGPVSQVTDGAQYASPPGVQDQPQDPKSALAVTGVEFNEKSLRLNWEGLPADERAEVYFRYPQQPRNFLEYRQIRFWAVPLQGSWGESGDHELLFKVGTDSRNYYVYRSALNPAAGSGGITVGDWLPEHVVDFQEWLALKADAERLLVEGAARPVILWSPDGRYGIVLQDRARAPNLAAVRELSLAVYNGGAVDSDGEVWIDDVRLTAGARDAGFAGRVDMDLNAGGFVSASASMGGRGGHFRQLGDLPSYETVQDLSVSATTELGRLAPPGWGVSLPVTASYLRTDLDPIFLQGTDVRADRLRGLRETGATRRRVAVVLRKTTPSSNPLMSALVDGTVLRGSHIRSSQATVTTAAELDGFEGGIEVDRGVAAVAVGIVPGFLESLLRVLAPRRVEQSAFFDRLIGARLRLTPERVGLSTSYLHHDDRVWRYDQVLESLSDLDVRAIRSPRRTLENGGRLVFRPLESLTARLGVISGRDVLDPHLATPLAEEREALSHARDHVGALPIGWERDRVFTTDAAFRPTITDWLRPSATWAGRYSQHRDPSHIARVPDGDTTVARLQRSFAGDRRLTRAIIFDLSGALRAALLPPGLIPDDTAGPGPLRDGWAADVLTLVSPIKPLEVAWTDETGSRFDRDLAEPDLGYQLGLGSLDPVRRINRDTAAIALVRNDFRARSGLRLGPSASLDVAYTESDGHVYDLRAGPRSRTERSWPDVRIAWRDPPVPDWAGLVIDSWSVSSGFARTASVTRLGADIVRVRSQVERTVPLELRLGFTSGLALSYIGSFTFGDGEDPTGLTDQNTMTHAASLGGRFYAPDALRAALPNPVRLSVSYDYYELRQSRLIISLAESITEPTPFSDRISRRVNFTLSSLISQMDVGVQASYVDRRSFIGTQAGSSQFQLALFGQFSMQAVTGQ